MEELRLNGNIFMLDYNLYSLLITGIPFFGFLQKMASFMWVLCMIDRVILMLYLKRYQFGNKGTPENQGVSLVYSSRSYTHQR